MWKSCESGSGRPLVLLHGIGMSAAAWNAVIPHLAPTRRVISFDIAGFGSTPPLPQGIAPTITNLTAALDRSIRELGLEPPIDIAGNSLGGTLALEAAKTGLARRVVAISPAGLWKVHDSLHVKYVFGGLRFLAVHFPGLMKATLERPWLRELALAVPISIGSWRMQASDALRTVDDLAGATAFEATFAHTRAPFSGAGVSASVTVAFGDLDWILPGRSQHRNGLPTDTAWVKKPGWGHVPMWSDSEGVARLILEGTR